MIGSTMLVRNGSKLEEYWEHLSWLKFGHFPSTGRPILYACIQDRQAFPPPAHIKCMGRIGGMSLFLMG